ncbi:uncharacterized protein [Nicotiana tomentosiformis]|uniref:uncharacterized protein n=1 Tax=Nicotiana tomentosiformis TaxID=4098 RepID=UPI00388C511C
MKKDIVKYIAQCLNYQEVKYEHQRPCGLLQRLEILEWKCERVTMDFVVGLPRSQRKFDAVWVIVDRLTKLAHSIPMVTTYSPEQLAQVLLRVSPMKGVMRFGKKGKLSPRYIGPFEILEKIGELDYKLVLPPSLVAVHPVFHVSMLWKYHSDPTHVLDFSSIQLDKELSYIKEPVAILDRQARKLRSKNIASVKV